MMNTQATRARATIPREVHEAAALVGQLTREEAIDRQKRVEAWETIERRVRGHNEDDRGCCNRHKIQDVAPAVDGAGELEIDSLLFGRHCAYVNGQKSDADEEHRKDGTHGHQRNPGIAAPRLTERRNAVGDSLNAG